MKLYKLQLDGMACGMCEAHVNDAVRKNADKKISKLKSNHKTNITTFVSDDNLNIDKIVKEIKELGYRVLDYKINDYKQENFFKKLFKK